MTLETSYVTWPFDQVDYPNVLMMMAQLDNWRGGAIRGTRSEIAYARKGMAARGLHIDPKISLHCASSSEHSHMNAYGIFYERRIKGEHG
jgi:hypothetical protein